jgi:hypothetical protein
MKTLDRLDALVASLGARNTRLMIPAASRMRTRLLLLPVAASTFSTACRHAAAVSDPSTATLSLAVSAQLAHEPLTPSQSYFGRNAHIEYVAGNAPVIYTAPHGGSLTPAEIPDRTSASCGESISTTTDLNTADLVRRMQQAHFARFGSYPHIVINHLHRRKLDANRTRAAGACGDAEAQAAWDEWHDFIGVARAAVIAGAGRGWYMDMHGHGHEKQRLELGYLTTGAQLRLDDATLDASEALEDTSSVNTLSRHAPPGFSALLRGSDALGTLYASDAFPSVPSAADPAPSGSDAYFSGGYNTARYGCGVEATTLGGASGGTICGVQVEANFAGVRDSETNRQRFAEATARVMEQYLGTHWGLQLGSGSSNSVPAANVATAKLTWSRSSARNVDVFRSGIRIASIANGGFHSDRIGTVRGTYTYRVCESGTSACSNEAVVTF